MWQYATQQLAALRMMLPSQKSKHFQRRCFFEWAQLCVGAEERRSRKIKRCVQRRREFFTPGALEGGCRIHLDRRLTGKTSLSPSNFGDFSTSTPRDALPPADPYRGLARDARNDVVVRRSSSVDAMRRGDVMPPGKLFSRFSHMQHMQHTPMG